MIHNTPTQGLRGVASNVPSWLLECNGNPAINTILENIDLYFSGYDYEGIDQLEEIHDVDHWGQYRDPADGKILPLWRPATIVWNNRLEYPATLESGEYKDNWHFVPKDASGNIGGSWLNQPRLLNMGSGTMFYQSQTLNESLHFQVTAEEVSVISVPGSGLGTMDIYMDDVLQGTYSLNTVPTTRQIATFETGDFSAFTNSSTDIVDFKQGIRSQKQTQGASSNIYALGTFTTPVDVSASVASDFLFFWAKITNAVNVNYLQLRLDFDATPTNFAYIQVENVQEGWNLICIRKDQITIQGTANWANIVKLAFRLSTNSGGSASVSIDDVKFVTPTTIFTKTGMDPLVMGHDLKIVCKGTGLINLGLVSMNSSTRATEMHNINRATGGLGQSLVALLKGDSAMVDYAKASMNLMCDIQLRDRSSNNRPIAGADSVGSIESASLNDGIVPGQRIVTANGFALIQFCLNFLMFKKKGLLTPAEEAKYLNFINLMCGYFITQGYDFGYWNVGNSNFQFGCGYYLSYLCTGNTTYKTKAEEIMNEAFSESSPKYHMVKGTLEDLVSNVDVGDLAIYFDEHDEYTTVTASGSASTSPIPLAGAVSAVASDNQILLKNGDTNKWVGLDLGNQQVEMIKLTSQTGAGINTWNATRGLLGSTASPYASGTKVYRTFDVGYTNVQMLMVVLYGHLSGNSFWVRVGKALYNTIKSLIDLDNGTYNNTGGSRQNTPSEPLEFAYDALLLLSQIDKAYFPDKSLLDNTQANLEYNLETFGYLNDPTTGGTQFTAGDLGRTSTYTFGIVAAVKYIFGFMGQ